MDTAKIWMPPELENLELDPYAIRIYVRISVLNETQEICDEEINQMATHCKMNRKTAYKALNNLLKHQVVEKIPRQGKSSHYRLNPPSKWTK